MSYRRVAQLRTAEAFRKHVAALGIEIPLDEALASGSDAPLAQPCTVYGKTIGNRLAVLPMEGWDGEPDGHANALVERRWRRFGESGGKLIWGGEAVAVRHDGRANPNQLILNKQTFGDIAALRETLVEAHRERFGITDDMLIGVQLTHSGRFARPSDKKRLEPQILYRHPLLDRKFGISPDYPLMTDGEIQKLIEDFVVAAKLAREAGFDFVDLKHCHGYLGHEFLSAVDRPGPYGGSFENRTRFLCELVQGIRSEVPGLHIGVRLSAFDLIAFRPGENGVGEPEHFDGEYRYAFGSDSTGMNIDLTEAHAFLDLLQSLDIRLVCLTAGSPYYNPHIQRPALFPPSDGYKPPEDPLVGVARQIHAVAELKRRHPDLLVVGSAYSYLQDWLPNVAQAVVRTGMCDLVGLGRMILSYPDMISDILAGNTMQRKRICRTFSDCTTAPRNGMVSGCYPLDEFYKQRPEAAALAALKQEEGEGLPES